MLFLPCAIFSQDQPFRSPTDPNPVFVGIIGLVPGLGQAYLGNSQAAAAQAGVFLGSSLATGEFYARKDYIQPRDQTIQYDYKQMLIAEALRKSGLLYNNLPLAQLPQYGGWFSEADWQRTLVMIKYHQLVQVNPLIQYGSYTRTNSTTIQSEIWGEPATVAMFYSSYSSYRDAGGLPDKQNESFWDLAAAPFQPRNIFDPWVIAPLVGILALSGKSPPTLVNPQLAQNKGQQAAYVLVPSYGAGVSEEAFFRGFLNHSMSQAWGPGAGIAVSGTLFGLAHLGNSPTLRPADVIPQLLGGYYLGYLHYKNHWDLGQSIALHFWWDIIAFALEVKSFKGDPSAAKNQRQVHYMPIRYSIPF
ncbi:MAG: CPBP family intramembrane metalloprotease [Spirochaetia bacterium]|nr:CPBP family intramembrane metalloprotease [Spirochaetia bacterium]